MKPARLIIVSGSSGSGKSEALNILEDNGFFTIDNLPVPLLPQLVPRLLQENNSGHTGLAVSIDARNRIEDIAQFDTILKQLTMAGVTTNILFLDASRDIITKRFSETRRRHPLSDEEGSLEDALNHEIKILEDICAKADINIDTSNMSIHDLRARITQLFAENTDTNLLVLIQSFGFKYGVPANSDFMFDVRCLPNPHWDAELRPFTGLDQPVQDFLSREEEVQSMLNDIVGFIQTWLPKISATNRAYLTISIGCTGGKHRSVFLTEQVQKAISLNYSNITTRHRELARTLS